METFAINLHFIAGSIEGFNTSSVLYVSLSCAFSVCRMVFTSTSFNAGDICARAGFI